MRRDYWDKRKWHIFAILLPGHEALLKCKLRTSELNIETVLIYRNSVDLRANGLAKIVFKYNLSIFTSVYISEIPNRS